MLFNPQDYALPTPPKFNSYIKQFKHDNNYRKSKDYNKTCFYCKHSVLKEFETASGRKRKIKCTKLGLTCSQKTDVSKFSVCHLYEKNT